MAKQKQKTKRNSRNKKKKKKSFSKRVLWIFAKITLIFILAISLFIGAVHIGVFGHLYSSEELKGFENENASLWYSSDQQLLGKIFAENRTNVAYEDLPQYLVDALVATEDSRFFEHGGVDGRSLLRVFFKTLLLNQKNSGGGSTLTQQLAKNMYGRKNFGFLTMPVIKCKEALLAYRLEGIYDKKEILRLYLNTVPFGENVYGVQAASQRYFNVSVSKLRVEQAAVIIGILKANTYYNPRLRPENALKRRNTVLNQMHKYGYLQKAELDSLKGIKLNISYANLQTKGPANYFLYEAKKELNVILEKVNKSSEKDWDPKKDGLIIETTLNAGLQRAALHSFKDHLGKMQKLLRKQYSTGSSLAQIEKKISKQLEKLELDGKVKRKQEIFSWDGYYTDSISAFDSLYLSMTMLHAGLIGIDPKDGGVRCYVGGIDFTKQPNDQIKAKRSLASTFKPILYAAALENGWEPCDYLSNEPLVLEDFDDWTPKNYDLQSGGKYSIAASLAYSKNIPTVNLYQDLGFKELDYLWRKLGFSSNLKNLPSSALGSTSASVMEVSKAYASFANGGKSIETYRIVSVKSADGEIIYQRPKSKKKDRILSEASTVNLNKILRKAVLEGTGRSLKNIYGVKTAFAGKTGTAQDFSDGWFVAYNPSIVFACRVGASSPSIHFNKGYNGSGSKIALPLIAKTLREAEKTRALRALMNDRFSFSDSLALDEMNCPDFKESNVIDQILDLFEKEGVEIDKKPENKEEKRSLIDRLFNRNKTEEY